MTGVPLPCPICNGKSFHYANCPWAGAETYALSGLLRFPPDVEAAVDTALEPRRLTGCIDFDEIREMLGGAILAERLRCAKAATEVGITTFASPEFKRQVETARQTIHDVILSGSP